MSKATYTLRQLILYALKLGTIGFGGPVALVGYMHRDLVEQRKWITEAEYKEGLTLAQLAPGPLAAQTAIYLGYVHYHILGATLAGFAFVLPSFLMVIALGWFYKLYGGLSWMQAVFYSVGASIIGIIARSTQKLASKTIGKDFLLWVIFAGTMAVTFLTEQENIPLIIFAGILTWAIYRFQNQISKSKAVKIAGAAFIVLSAVVAIQILKNSGAQEIVIKNLDSGNLSQTFWHLLTFFTKAGAFVFGSGLAIVPFLFHGVVKEYQWLTDQQFLDAVAVAMITPGPVVITTAFIGYLVAGFAGACVAAFATFFPCYLFTIIPAPFMKKHGTVPGVIAFIDGITAAAVGAIAGAVVVLGKRSITDIPTVIIAAATYLILWKSKKISEPVLIVIVAVIGLILKGH